jgi:hypothetical protein
MVCNRKLARAAALLALLAVLGPGGIAAAKPYVPKTTPWGDPDLRGTWPLDDLAFLPLQRAPRFGDQEFLTEAQYQDRQKQLAKVRGDAEAAAKGGRLVGEFFLERTGAGRRTAMLVDPPNGRLPELTEEGKRRADAARSIWVAGQAFDGVEDFDSWSRCITVGFPAAMLPRHHNNGIRIFQSPGYVAISLEMIHDTRIIPIGGPIGANDHWPAGVTSWMGDSRGRWEGGSLVIETTHIRPGASPINAATLGAPPKDTIPTSGTARVVERLTMTGPDTILYEVTYSDPVIWTAPFTARLDWRRDETYRMFEYACHEGNAVVRDNIVASRAQRGR